MLNPACCRRYLRNLPSTYTEADLSLLFAPFGGVKVRASTFTNLSS